MSVTRKMEIPAIDGTPVKRMFWSIISDYDLTTGICELIDNALDFWMVGNRKKPLTVTINLDVDRQLISVKDNAGGVAESELRLLIVPGGSRNDPNAELIGIFGVGGKRAAIALGEHVEIRTRFRSEQTCEIDVTKEWLESEDWNLTAYHVPDITPNTTQVDVSRLRRTFSQQDVQDMVVHIGEAYAWFLRRGCTIEVNGTSANPKAFDTWAFPGEFSPHAAKFDVDFGPEGKISVAITAGLIRDRIPEQDNYGVYIYCNHRLVVKELKTRDVGYFVTTEAGVPHSDASLCRAIVELQGPAKLMPWNSSKSDINTGHPTFREIRPTLIRLVSHFSSLSRRLKDDWEQKVFRHATGTITKIAPEEITAGKRLNLPPLPKVNRPKAEKLKDRNKTQLRNKPWTLGLLEAMAAVDIIRRQRLQTRNRVALILLDSNFEIALKEFIVHRQDLFPPNQFDDAKIQQLFQKRHLVIAAVSQKMPIPPVLLDKARHYYGLRNKLIHERATVDITDADVDNYRSTIQDLLNILFDLKFARR